LADLNGDGRQEMISGSWPGEIYVFQRKSSGAFAAADKLKDKSGTILNAGKASAIALGDWDADGDLDMLVGNIDGAVFKVRNEGSAKKAAFATPEKLTDIAAKEGDAGPCLADWDGDGKLDLLVGSGSGEVTLFRNRGSAQQPKWKDAETLVAAYPASESKPAEVKDPKRSCKRTKVAVADWNGDGKPDLLVGDFISAPERDYHGWVWVYLRKAPQTAQTD
jgi:VCBS repeat protein